MIGHLNLKLVQCAGAHKVCDSLTKSLLRPAVEKQAKDREYVIGTRVSLSVFYASVKCKIVKLCR